MVEHFWASVPSAFPALALAHFIALISPGPDFFLIVGHAVRRGLPGAIYICVGIALGNAAYIALAIVGWSGLKLYPGLYRAVEIAGAAYLLWMGTLLLRSGFKGAAHQLMGKEALSPFLQLLAGLSSALLNPKNAIFYLSLMTGFIGSSATTGQLAFSALWMFLVVLIWDIAIAAFISCSWINKSLSKILSAIELISGAVLIIIAVCLLVGTGFSNFS